MQESKAPTTGDDPWPSEIRVRDEGRTLRTTFDDRA